jgi:hypothetical protein
MRSSAPAYTKSARLDPFVQPARNEAMLSSGDEPFALCSWATAAATCTLMFYVASGVRHASGLVFMEAFVHQFKKVLALKKNGTWHEGKALHEIIGTGVPKVQQAATALGVSYQTVYRWFEREELPQGKAKQIAEVLGCSQQWLESGTGERYYGIHDVTQAQQAVERAKLRFIAEMRRLQEEYTAEIVEILANQHESPAVTRSRS